MASYKVLAPYVTLQVHDANGAVVVQGFYEGGVATDPVEGDVLDKHVRNNWVEKVSVTEGSSVTEGPKPGTVEFVLDEVGDDQAKAATALEAELAAEKPRSTLVEKLEAIATNPGN